VARKVSSALAEEVNRFNSLNPESAPGGTQHSPKGDPTMPLLPENNSSNPKYDDSLRLQDYWAWFFALGTAIMVLGFLAIGAAFITTFTTILVFGILMMGGGVVQLVNACLGRSWRAFFLHLLSGVLYLIVGGLMIERPIGFAVAITLILAVAFLASGTLRILLALIERFPGWGWVLANGIITLMLGIAIWRRWPEDSLWVIGLFVGIELVFNGLSWVMFGLLVKAPGPQEYLPESKKEMETPVGQR
jgi:uncharacterized membrane protein HdeD (DUF308 family)